VIAWISGSSSAVERKLPKLDVAGSIPVSRSLWPLSKERGFFYGVLGGKEMALLSGPGFVHSF
jgi:hypothetical protein